MTCVASSASSTFGICASREPTDSNDTSISASSAMEPRDILKRRQKPVSFHIYSSPLYNCLMHWNVFEGSLRLSQALEAIGIVIV
jgi:hypothetical protein